MHFHVETHNASHIELLAEKCIYMSRIVQLKENGRFSQFDGWKKFELVKQFGKQIESVLNKSVFFVSLKIENAGHKRVKIVYLLVSADIVLT